MQVPNKRQQILEAATRRLAHFGLLKTNMADIAQDLGISKASLYYYFPDKNNLYAAVFTFIVENEIQDTQQSLQAIESCRDSVDELLRRRTGFVKRYHTLLSGLVTEHNPLGEGTAKVLAAFRHTQALLLQEVLEKGIRMGEIEPDIDVYETAMLFLVALEGMRFFILNERDDRVFPTEEEFDKIANFQKKMSRILLKGLAP